jgi:hypothetical protein
MYFGFLCSKGALKLIMQVRIQISEDMLQTTLAWNFFLSHVN